MTGSNFLDSLLSVHKRWLYLNRPQDEWEEAVSCQQLLFVLQVFLKTHCYYLTSYFLIVVHNVVCNELFTSFQVAKLEIFACTLF